MFDVVVENGLVLDGTGNPWFRTDIGVKEDKIKELDDLSNESAEKRINANNKIVSPGFIDMHSHSDLRILEDPSIKQKIAQGITTELLGQDGLSIYPLNNDTKSIMLERTSGLLGKAKIDVNWETLPEYFNKIEEKGSGTNIVTLIPHGNVRGKVMGFDDRKLTENELEKMKNEIDTLMNQGAAGLSTGLIYPPCSYSDKNELTELCKTVADDEGIFVVHMRSESDKILDAVDEVIGVVEDSGVPLEISHFKAAFKENWGITKKTLAKVDEARNKGIEVTFDQYPYIAGSTMLDSVLSDWALDGGTDKMLERLQDKEIREKIKKEIRKDTMEGENWIYGCGADNIMITSVETEDNQEVVGKTLDEIGEMWNMNPIDAAMDLLVKEEAAVCMVVFYGDEGDVSRIMSHRAGMACTDGILSGRPHPRTFGAMPKILGKFVREEGVLSLEDAVRRMTSMPARKLGLSDRGIISEGFKADLVVFNPDTVKAISTYENPKQYPKGINYVLINGELAIDKGKRTDNISGEVLKT